MGVGLVDRVACGVPSVELTNLLLDLLLPGAVGGLGLVLRRHRVRAPPGVVVVVVADALDRLLVEPERRIGTSDLPHVRNQDLGHHQQEDPEPEHASDRRADLLDGLPDAVEPPECSAEAAPSVDWLGSVGVRRPTSAPLEVTVDRPEAADTEGLVLGELLSHQPTTVLPGDGDRPDTLERDHYHQVDKADLHVHPPREVVEVVEHQVDVQHDQRQSQPEADNALCPGQAPVDLVTDPLGLLLVEASVDAVNQLLEPLPAAAADHDARQRGVRECDQRAATVEDAGPLPLDGV